MPDAVTDRAVAAALRQRLCIAVEGWAVIVGNPVTITAPEIFDVMLHPFELVTIQ